MSDRLDRIELLLENLAISQQATQNQIDATQRQLEAVILHVDSLAENATDLKTRQIRINSIAWRL